MSGRDRRQGWQHAKRSGHKYEVQLADELNTNQAPVLQQMIEAVGGAEFVHADSSFGTSHLTSILGGVTSSKADIVATLFNQSNVGISVKKSNGGQVWIVTYDRFVRGMNYFGVYLPPKADWVLRALTGETNGQSIQTFAPNAVFSRTTKGVLFEPRDNRLVCETIANYYPAEWEEFVHFFANNYQLVVDLAFRRGLLDDEDGMADIVYYKQGNGFTIADIMMLENSDFKTLDQNSRTKSTLWLPFGFLQVHRPTPSGQPKTGPFVLQFHHRLDRILENICS